nr:type II toxin-antitoxin system VapC family toxin [Polymorphobacter sp.]
MAALVDSSGWIEYFTQGANAAAFRPAIIATSDLIVPTICIYEVYRYVARVRDATSAARSAAAMMLAKVIDLDPDLAVMAAQLSAAHRLPMADSIILTTARKFDAILWTQDVDFAGIEGVRYLPKAA